MWAVLFVVVVLGAVLLIAARIIAEREEHTARIDPSMPRPRPGWVPPAGQDSSDAPHLPESGFVGLSAILEGIRVPDDMVPFTRNLRPMDLETRFVLWTTSSLVEAREEIATALSEIGIDLEWDGLHGRGRRHGRTLVVVLHPPVDPAVIEVPEPKRKRGPKSMLPPPERPDFPGAPFGATVVELAPEGLG